MLPPPLAAFGLTLLRWLGKVLTFGLTLPLWLFIAAGVWLWVDRESAVRTAVDLAVKELVAGEEIAALKARAVALQKINAEAERRREALERANRLYAEMLAETNREKQELSDEINDLMAQPVPDRCDVDGRLIDRLRNR